MRTVVSLRIGSTAPDAVSCTTAPPARVRTVWCLPDPGAKVTSSQSDPSLGSPANALSPAAGPSISGATTKQHVHPRHHWVVRLTHWVNVVALGLMITSGLRIFNAYPAFAR